MNDNTDQDKPGKVLISCPTCGKKFRKGDKAPTAVNLVLIPGSIEPQPELPQVVCLSCGVKFFPPEVLAVIKENLEKQGSKIIVPQMQVKNTIPRFN